MGAYRLYTVVPFLVRFIDSLTNIYVRYNRKRLKGGKGTDDCLYALTSLFDVLLSVCKVGGHSVRDSLVRRLWCAMWVMRPERAPCKLHQPASLLPEATCCLVLSTPLPLLGPSHYRITR